MTETTTPMTVTFTQTDTFTVQLVWGNGSHTGEITRLSDEDMMAAIGRFVWMSLDTCESSNDE